MPIFVLSFRQRTLLPRAVYDLAHLRTKRLKINSTINRSLSAVATLYNPLGVTQPYRGNPEPYPKPNPKPNLTPNPKPNPKPNPQPNPKPNPKPNSKPNPKPNPKLNPKVGFSLDYSIGAPIFLTG